MTAPRDITLVVLCGGKGERLRPLTDTLPKPLVTLNERPLLAHLLDFLSAAGLRRTVICTGYRAAAIEAFIAEKRRPEWGDVVCVNAGVDATMTERLLAARPHVADRALVCYGDTLANVNLGQLVRTHEESGREATVTVYRMRSPFGIVEMDEQLRVTRFAEKPVLPYWINIGFFLFDPSALDRLKRGGDMIGYLEDLSRDGALGVYKHEGRHLTVNTEEELAAAEKVIELFRSTDA
jgi:glucose-1-phosphate cytidylyltransferase